MMVDRRWTRRDFLTTTAVAVGHRAADQGVYQHLIMCDGEGRLGDPDEAERRQAVDNHRKWIDAAKALGCATIRVNAASAGTFEEQHASHVKASQPVMVLLSYASHEEGPDPRRNGRHREAPVA